MSGDDIGNTEKLVIEHRELRTDLDPDEKWPETLEIDIEDRGDFEDLLNAILDMVGRGRPHANMKPLLEQEDLNILEEANETVGQRAEEYGPPTENFQAIADLWSAYLGVEITPYDYSQMMILAKIGRTKTGSPDRDTHTDQAGYSLTTQLVHDDGAEPADYKSE